jgi:hypothetical protein
MKAFSRQPIYYAETKTVDKQDGMDLRDYFASKAMLGFIASSPQPRNYNEHEMAKISYQMADAMMKAREQ